jgi:hypothetical protein
LGELSDNEADIHHARKASGADPKALADQAGHDIGVSVSVYTQTSIESKINIGNALEKMILG